MSGHPGASSDELGQARAALARVEAVMVRCNEARRREANAGRPDTAAAYDDAAEWLRRALTGDAS